MRFESSSEHFIEAVCAFISQYRVPDDMLVEIMNADDAQVSGHNQIRGRIAAACRAGDFKVGSVNDCPSPFPGGRKAALASTFIRGYLTCIFCIGFRVEEI
jgi:hypothetical protein